MFWFVLNQQTINFYQLFMKIEKFKPKFPVNYGSEYELIDYYFKKR